VSWKFPKFPIKAGRLTDALDTDDNFLEFVEEVGGELNEHNWQDKTDAGPARRFQRTDVSRDDLFVWHSDGVAKHGGGVPTAQSEFLDGPAAAANTVYLSSASSWSALPGTTVTFTSPNTLLWIHASLQAVNDSPGTLTWWKAARFDVGGTTIRYDDTFSNLLIGIAVDDYLIPESVVGGAEPSNDRNYGVMMPSMPLATSIVYPITAGEHKVSLFVRVAPKMGSVINGSASEPEELINDGSGTGSWDGIGIHFEHREVMVLEMRR